MATLNQTPHVSQAATKAVKPAKPLVRLSERMKSQLNGAVLRGGKVTADELQDLEQHIKKIAALLA